MGFLDFLKSAKNFLNEGLKKSKIVSTLAPALPIPYASQIGSVAKNLGYVKGGRVLKKSGMKKGGKVKKVKVMKAKKPKKAKK
jgi:hypothetical protein